MKRQIGMRASAECPVEVMGICYIYQLCHLIPGSLNQLLLYNSFFLYSSQYGARAAPPQHTSLHPLHFSEMYTGPVEWYTLSKKAQFDRSEQCTGGQGEWFSSAEGGDAVLRENEPPGPRCCSLPLRVSVQHVAEIACPPMLALLRSVISPSTAAQMLSTVCRSRHLQQGTLIDPACFAGEKHECTLREDDDGHLQTRDFASTRTVKGLLVISTTA
ncbi:hypothetical protein Z043_102611 [Scleropages formosus]|uniref:Uncharacterized protein n=1 Tax=Scleropages formosus TaxID=113540 RepID=A0A0P7V780_SCLFO|nr:hypothetical protein Z043_102611 [Scleropages formosus]